MNKTYSASIVFSLIIHTAFLFVSQHIDVDSSYYQLSPSRKTMRVKTVQINSETSQKEIRFQKKSIDPLQMHPPEPKKALKTVPEKKNLKKNKNFLINDEPSNLKSFKKEFEDRMLKMTQLAFEVKTRLASSKLIRFDNIPNTVGVTTAKDFNANVADIEFVDKMPGLTPKRVESHMVDRFHEGDATQIKKSTGPIYDNKKFERIDEFLITDMSVYRDKKNGNNYFQLSVYSGKDIGKLMPLNKEVIFLIDSSLSIQAKRAAEFKRGVKNTLNLLNKGDYFNVIIFKSGARRFREQSVPALNGTITSAYQFLDELTADQRTDVYKAVVDTLHIKESLIPSYIILLSDGRPTFGVTDSQNVINQIADLNQGKRSIYSFSGGVRVNRYLLDFVAYKNRGWSEYAARTADIDTKIEDLYLKIQHPLLLNMRYNLSGVKEEHVYPQQLPDFFKDTEFTLFGKFHDDEDMFSIQVLGDTHEETKEFIFSGSLKNAKEGTESIARQWAFNRIYHLIGMLSGDEPRDRGVLNEIKNLSMNFNIKTPYSDELFA